MPKHSISFLTELGDGLDAGRTRLLNRRRNTARVAVVVATVAVVGGMAASMIQRSSVQLEVAAISGTELDGTTVAPSSWSAGSDVSADPSETIRPASLLFGLASRAGHTLTSVDGGVLVWGGWSDGQASDVFADGAVFSVDGEDWTGIAPAPGGRGFHDAVWSGSEVIMVGGATAVGTLDRTVLAYDPTRDRWRRLADLPEEFTSPDDMSSVSVGDGVVVLDRRSKAMVFIGSDDYPGHVERIEDPGIGPVGAVRSDGFVLFAVAGEGFEEPTRVALRDGIDGSWVEMDMVLTGDAFPNSSAVAAGNLIVWSRQGADGAAFLLDTARRAWVEIDPPPLAACEGSTAPLEIVDGALVLDLCRSSEGMLRWVHLSVDDDGVAWSDIGILEGAGFGPSQVHEGMLTHLGYCCGVRGTDSFSWLYAVKSLP